MTAETNQVDPESQPKQETAQDEAKLDSAQAETENQGAADDEPAGEDLAAELAKAQITIKDYWDQIMRLNAEIENNRKRAQRDIENAHKYATQQFAEALLPVVDSMEMGIAASENENASHESIREGMQMTLEMFSKTMQKNGIETVHPVGEKFNPEHHQAMTLQESEEHDPNTVIAVMQKGYLLNERLIRPAMVVVSKAKE